MSTEKYLDITLPPKERAEDLLGRETLSGGDS